MKPWNWSPKSHCSLKAGQKSRYREKKQNKMDRGGDVSQKESSFGALEGKYGN